MVDVPRVVAPVVVVLRVVVLSPCKFHGSLSVVLKQRHFNLRFQPISWLLRNNIYLKNCLLLLLSFKNVNMPFPFLLDYVLSIHTIGVPVRLLSIHHEFVHKQL